MKTTARQEAVIVELPSALLHPRAADALVLAASPLRGAGHPTEAEVVPLRGRRLERPAVTLDREAL